MIGFFDSGFGGLTILKEVLGVDVKSGLAKKIDVKSGTKKITSVSLSAYDFIYLGDTARAPYGNHSPETIYRFTTEAVDFLFRQGCELVVLACFSASANALRKIQQEWLPTHYPNKKVLGVLIPTAESAALLSKKGKVGILGTRATVKSGALETELKKRRADLQIISQAAPLLVPLIEEGWDKRLETKKILRYYLKPLKKSAIDTLILACTHYPVLQKEIKIMMGKKVTIINPGEAEKKSLADYLLRHPEIEEKLSQKGQCRFLTTDRPEDFERLGSKFLGWSFKAEKVSL
ncbi:MAG TPA: glutamate racemase [Candidatus Magasanikbacteria bacterium]|uniref:Glutamate racemase n=1 Tax=Candidatus Magasanikbacteria bacterium GW2011_GWA2_42_32 TaxID=1619039 RepID=A0A0G1A6S4_9BACT|nr:MAG: Glutamate racemase [Candidatus Magasanikbacteria bacterium GW2011_GWC2_40_17]KKS56725.1 MAG: Glutamate racemase [Candidatus Magasanikbacteria bacterium GW2011_GWA2_42_32]OGH85986.1 MAG: glutamate racemase [Candidatus Magasanikbacteria bacterium RIFOXYB2_FULL_38_10]HBV58027.1 glutamate racemase [Candidatus Magasanikbacteria bacterium]